MDRDEFLRNALLLLRAGAASERVGALGEATSEAGENLGEGLSRLAKELEQLQILQRIQVERLEANTEALQQNSSSLAGKGASTGGTIGRTAASLLGGGLGLKPIASGLTRLFRREKEPAEPLLTPFTPPRPLHPEAGIASPGSIQPVDFGSGGLPRLAGADHQKPAPAVTIQVQTIDSRSFLDHSEEIARAVREALLNSHSLNDILGEI